jgi:hypothetical protein
MRPERESGRFRRIQQGVCDSQPAQKAGQTGRPPFDWKRGESRNADHNQTSGPGHAIHFAQRQPEASIVLKNGIAKHRIERFVRKAGQRVGIPAEDFEIGVAARPIEVDADLAFRPGNGR